MADLRAHDWIRHHARRRPEKCAIVDFESGSKLTYREMDRQADACAAFLHRSHNIMPGDRVALLAQNCPEVFVIQAACARLRAILLPLNWRLAEPELDYMLSDAAPNAVLADARFIVTAEAICAKQGGCEAVQIGDGTEFDSSYKRKNPSEFPLNRVIKGWQEVVQLMPVGSKWEVAIPSRLGYGSQDIGNIPPNSALIFEIEMLGIK